jgi:hypothetical protein
MDFSPECERRLGYHPSQNATQVALFEENRRKFMELWDHLACAYEPSRELSLALTALQEAMMWANAHIACNGVGAE